MIRKSIFTLILFGALCALSYAQKGVFSIDKSKLIDADGQVFVIRGINNPHAWFGERAYAALDDIKAVGSNTSGDRLTDMAKWYAEPNRVEMLLKYERYLLLNIANEWGAHNTKANYWQSSYARCIDIMRKAGYTTTLVIDAPGWGQNIDLMS